MRSLKALRIFLLVAVSSHAAIAGVLTPADVRVESHAPAIAMFLLFVGISLFITYRSSKKAKSASDFYAAGSGISPLQNGLAIAGDFMSAAAFLGISALLYTSGFDGALYLMGFCISWPIVLFLIAERLRNLGLYTMSDATSFRLDKRAVRILSAIGSLTVVAFYLIAQMVGAGQVVELLFGLQYPYAVLIVCVLTITYVSVGGMKATTWVQITKAFLLLSGAITLAGLVLWHYGFSVTRLLTEAVAVHPKGAAILAPGGMFSEPVSAVSLGLALMFGTSGLPHILMRFYTVKDANCARTSVFYASCFITAFSIFMPLIGFGAIGILMNDPEYFVGGAAGNKLTAMIGGSNMVALHLASSLGGPLFFGFIAAVAFATILAVVAGLTLAAASAVSHDLYGQVIAKGKAPQGREVLVSKLTAVAVGILAGLLSLLFRTQNVAFMVGIALAVAASCNFPVLLMSLYWKGMTTRGALAGGILGLVCSVAMVVASKTVWVNVFGFQHALFPYDNPTLFSMPLAFLAIFFFSVLDRSPRGLSERTAFGAQYVRSETGLRLSVLGS